MVLDVGGDVVGRGPEPTLKSPLADSLTLAAALVTGMPTTLVLLGPGSDAELPVEEVLKLLQLVGGQVVGQVRSEDVELLEAVLSWHPTEATALVAAGAEGVRGSVAMRRGRDPVPLTEHTPEAWEVPDPYFEQFPLAGLLRRTKTLSEAEDVMRTFAVNEIDFERTVTGETPTHRRSMPLPDLISEMTSVGATHITARRVSEIFTPGQVDQFTSGGQRSTGGLWSRDTLVRLAASLEG